MKRFKDLTPEEKEAKLARIRQTIKEGKVKIVCADTTKIKSLKPYVDIILEKLGYSGALVTDEALIGDLGVKKAQLVGLFKFKVRKRDYIWQVAERLKESEPECLLKDTSCCLT